VPTIGCKSRYDLVQAQVVGDRRTQLEESGRVQSRVTLGADAGWVEQAEPFQSIALLKIRPGCLQSVISFLSLLRHLNFLRPGALPLSNHIWRPADSNSACPRADCGPPPRARCRPHL
jgi:hypothetical protein